MKTVDALTVTLSVMGGMSWGLYGINNMDPVEILEGWKGASLTSALYLCVALAAVQEASTRRQGRPRSSVAYEKN